MPLLVIGSIPAYTFITDSGNVANAPFQNPGLDAALKALGRPTDPVAMRMYPQVSIQVAFENITMPREPVDRTLEDILKLVADIIPRFDGFF